MNYLTDPAMFERFHKALTSERKGYTPWYFLLSKGLKDPVAGISWKQLEGRLTFEQAVIKMRSGHNIGIAATGMDPLCIVDVDDITATPDEIVKPTLTTRSRKRIGRHYFYFTEDPRCKENLPTDDKGEIRSRFEYVVAPGSFVICDNETTNAMPEEQREHAGRYTMERERAPDMITFEELPPVFLEQAQKNREIEKEAQEKRKAKAKARKDKNPTQGSDKNKSAMWDLSMDDVLSVPNKTRFTSLFHESTTGKNTARNDDGGLTCFRHLVTHTALSALAVLAGVTDCNSAGQGFNNGKSSSIDYGDGMTLFKIWQYAKREGITPASDPIPAAALRWYAIKNGICKPDEIMDGWKLPSGAYRRTLEAIEDKEKLATGRHAAKPDAARTGFDETFRERFIIGENSPRFDHNEFAKWLLLESGERFATITDNNHVYRYAKGIYIPYGEAFIKQQTQEAMDGFLLSERARNEVVGHIRALTPTNRDEFDKDKDVINMRNGLYHLESGEFTPHTPDYRSLSKMDVKYDPSAECPNIDKFVNDVVEPKRVEAIYEIAGYAILPNKRLKRGVIFVGDPDTGKSTMIDIMCKFVGIDRICDVSPSAIGEDNHATYDIFGKLMNRIDDLGTTPITETGILKSIISSAPIRANQKYGAPFTFIPSVLILYGCNQVPVCADTHMQSKFDILMYTNVHSDKDIDPDLPEKLTSDDEMSGLFNKAMISVKKAIRNRTFTGSYTISDMGREYEYHSNPLSRFIDEYGDLTDPEAITDKKTFRKIYTEWSKEHRFKIVSVGAQTTFLQDRGVMVRKLGTRDDRAEYYIGLEMNMSGKKKRVQTVSPPCPDEKPMVFHDEEAVSISGVPCPKTSLGSTEKIRGKKEEENICNRVECNADTDTVRKNDSSPQKCGQDTALTPNGHQNRPMCGECGKPLSGETFLGKSGKGAICAECQAVVDRSKFGATSKNENLLDMTKAAIFKLGYVKGISEFTSAQILMELPKGTGVTTEIIEAYLNDHATDMKVRRTDNGTWEQVK